MKVASYIQNGKRFDIILPELTNGVLIPLPFSKGAPRGNKNAVKDGKSKQPDIAMSDDEKLYRNNPKAWKEQQEVKRVAAEAGLAEKAKADKELEGRKQARLDRVREALRDESIHRGHLGSK